MKFIYFDLLALSVVIVRNPKTFKFLTVRETKNRGWWIPGGKVEPPEDPVTACIRECKEEAGIDIQLKGLIKVMYDLKEQKYLKMKFILYGEPIDCNQEPKCFSDSQSEEARWVSLEEYEELVKKPPYMRGDDLIVNAKYLLNGGIIHPLSVLDRQVFPEPTNIQS